MNAYRKYRVLIVAAACVAAVAAYFVSSEVETRLMRARVEALMGPAVHDMREEMLAGADPILYYLANCIQRELPTVASAASNPQRVSALMRTYALDEVNFADSNGVIRATTHASQKNYWMGTDPDPSKAAGFLCLLTNHLWYTQPPRRSVRADGAYRKFAGVRLPDGYLQLGFDFERLSRELKERFADTAVDWHVGDGGYYVIADAKTGEVISDGNPKIRFRPGLERKPIMVADLGFEPWMLKKGEGESFRAKIAGEDAVCRVVPLPESGHVFFVVVPMRDILHARNVSVGTMMFILLVLIAAAASVGLRAVALRERAEEARLAEEARRQKELMLATSIQSAALPSVFPPFPPIADCLDIYARMHAAKEVGGDFYDFYYVGERHLAMMVADVSGKGVPGAMFMMRAKTTLIDLLSRGGDLGKAVADVNSRLAEGNDANMFVSARTAALNGCATPRDLRSPRSTAWPTSRTRSSSVRATDCSSTRTAWSRRSRAASCSGRNASPPRLRPTSRTPRPPATWWKWPSTRSRRASRRRTTSRCSRSASTAPDARSPPLRRASPPPPPT